MKYSFYCRSDVTVKILIVSTFDVSGGAARAAYRLHKGLQSIGVESKMLVRTKTSDDFTVVGPRKKIKNIIGMLRSVLDALPVKLYITKNKTLFSPAWLPFGGIVHKINISDADIVHLHWIGGGMMCIEDIAKITKPIVWSLHDMWAFTGGCHYDSDCGRYANNCETCPVLNSNHRNDLSHYVFERKVKTFVKIPFLTIVGLSRWLTDCAKKSTLLAEKDIINLPNPIDTHTFRPLKRETARGLLDLPNNKKLVLFGAHNATKDPRKGFAEITTAMHLIKSTGLELLVFGSGSRLNSPDFGFPVHYLGHIPDDLSLRVLYSAADVMVVPSIQEAFGQTAIESMACGTPVVAFGATGLLDIIDHEQNGYLAAPYDPKSLAEGIDWILNYPSPQDLSHRAREKVLETFETTQVARQYLELYKAVLIKNK